MKTKLLVLIVVLGYITSCSKNNKNDKLVKKSFIEVEDSITCSSKYIYIDKDSTLHTKLGCGSAEFNLSDEVRNNYGVRRVLKINITQNELYKCCAICINDEKYEYLKNIVDSI